MNNNIKASLIIMPCAILVVLLLGLLLDKALCEESHAYLYWRFYHGSNSVRFHYIFDVMNKAEGNEITQLNNYLCNTTNGAVFLKATDIALQMVRRGDNRYRPFIESVLLGSKYANWQRRHIINYPLHNYPSTNTKYWLKIIASRDDDELAGVASSCLKTWKFNE